VLYWVLAVKVGIGKVYPPAHIKIINFTNYMRCIQTGRKRSDAKRKWLVMVDNEEFEHLSQFCMQADKDGSVSGSFKGKKRMLLPRYLLNAPDDMEVDHIDGNRLNNQKSNLRLATSSQNKMNRGPRSDNKSGYKGVSWHKQKNKWTVRIMANGRYKSLGLFNKIEKAKQAYNEAAQKYHGSFAWLNT
jgi:hypothetical protein